MTSHHIFHILWVRNKLQFPPPLNDRKLHKVSIPGGGNHETTLSSAHQTLTHLEGENNGDMKLSCIVDTNIH